MVLISAGFDGHIRDVVGGMRLTDQGYREIGEQVLRMAEGSAEGRIISLLEGGYDLRGLVGGVTSYLGRLIEG